MVTVLNSEMNLATLSVTEAKVMRRPTWIVLLVLLVVASTGCSFDPHRLAYLIPDFFPLRSLEFHNTEISMCAVAVYSLESGFARKFDASRAVLTLKKRANHIRRKQYPLRSIWDVISFLLQHEEDAQYQENERYNSWRKTPVPELYDPDRKNSYLKRRIDQAYRCLSKSKKYLKIFDEFIEGQFAYYAVSKLLHQMLLFVPKRNIVFIIAH